jgi:hypothetical protein
MSPSSSQIALFEKSRALALSSELCLQLQGKPATAGSAAEQGS